MTPIILPEGLVASWGRAIASPDLRHWSSLAIALSDLWAQEAMLRPDSPKADDLRCLANLAWRHMRDLMPDAELPVLEVAA